MKKALALVLAVIFVFMCVSITGCGSSDVKLAKDKIIVYSGVGDKKGIELVTVKDTNAQAEKDMEQIFSDVKQESQKDKIETDMAKEIYYVDFLNYDEDGNKTSTSNILIYFIDDKVYCYYPEKQTFSDGDYYLNGYTNVTQEAINKIVSVEQ